MTTPNLDDLLGNPTQVVGRLREFPADVARARHAEQARRSSRVQALARKALTHLHPEDYRSLYEQAKERLAAEWGPLPGDPDYEDAS